MSAPQAASIRFIKRDLQRTSRKSHPSSGNLMILTKPSSAPQPSGSEDWPAPPTTLMHNRLTNIDELLKSHQRALCLSLSLLVGIISLFEPLAAHAIRNEGWLIPSIIVAIACFINASLAQGRCARLATHILVILLACFVTIQIGHHTGITWAFVFPPMVLFLHPIKRGIFYIIGIVLVVTAGFAIAHANLNLRDHEPFEFWASFFTVTAVSALIGRDLSTTVKAVITVAFRDPLTGLYQRDLFLELAGHQLEVARRDKGCFSLLAIDIDNMKTVNDQSGHAAGDVVLKSVATLLNRELRGADFSARFGGDEFVISLTGVGEAQAMAVAGRLIHHAQHSEEWCAWRTQASLSLSIGIAHYPAQGDTLAGLVDAADTALLQAKARGKNQIVSAPSDDGRSAPSPGHSLVGSEMSIHG